MLDTSIVPFELKSSGDSILLEFSVEVNLTIHGIGESVDNEWRRIYLFYIFDRPLLHHLLIEELVCCPELPDELG
jgi:hypothetical protein